MPANTARLFLCLAAIMAAAPALAAPAPTPAPALPGDKALSALPECDDIRSGSSLGFLEGPPSLALRSGEELIVNDYGRWKRSVRREGDHFYVILSPEREGAYPVYAQGAWILKRSYPKGELLQAKVFLRSDPGCFFRLMPAGDRSSLDIVLYGGTIRKDLLLPLSFHEAVLSPVSRIVGLSKDSMSWGLYSPEPGIYAPARALVAAVRAALPSLAYADDGALDASGRPVLIATGAPQGPSPGLNCSGFALWLVNGLYKVLAGTYLEPAAMKARRLDERGSSFTEPYEDSLDPYFGLDWIRNMAQAVAAVSDKPRAGLPPSQDVTLSPFALYNPYLDPINGSVPYEPYPDRTEDGGYQPAGLKALLALLSVKEPGKIYLAAFSRRSEAGAKLRTFFHVAVFIPYYETTGEFRIAVFESAAETSIEAVMARSQEQDLVHLVRIDLPDRGFSPQPFPDGKAFPAGKAP